MIAESMVALVLSHGGWWYAGDEQLVAARITAREVAEQQGSTELELTLRLGDATIERSIVRPVSLTDSMAWSVEAPNVEVTVALEVGWRLLDGQRGGVIDSGAETVRVVPRETAAKWLRRVADVVDVTVLDPSGELSDGLTAMNVTHRRVKGVDSLTVDDGLVIVAEGALTGASFEQRALLTAASRGLLVLCQRIEGPTMLFGLGLLKKTGRGELRWTASGKAWFGDLSDAGPPVWDLAGLGKPASPSCLAGDFQGSTVLMEREPAEGEHAEAGVFAVDLRSWAGRRIVLWQAPLGPIDHDPRTALLIASAMRHLAKATAPRPARSVPHGVSP
ncbi:MAG: hypothetical protein AAGB29_01265 [Planctomycetota bacterium]